MEDLLVNSPITDDIRSKRFAPEDHNYVATPSHKRRKMGMEQLSEKTVEVLQSINNNLSEFNVNIKVMTKAINNLAEKFSK